MVRGGIVALIVALAACSQPGRPAEFECINDADCGAGTICSAGFCESSGPTDTGVTFDAGPPRDAGRLDTGPFDSGQTMEVVCRTDLDCTPPTTVCSPRRRCGPSCLQNGCGPDESCDMNTGRCVPDSAGGNCQRDMDCDPPQTVCEGSRCVVGCAEPGAMVYCGPNQVCQPATGHCETAPACMNDGECPEYAPLCENDACTYGCHQPDGPLCGPEEICDPDTYRCRLEFCGVDADCMAPTPYCEPITGICYGCFDDAQCPTTCDLATGMCV